jgi:spore germination cell wall hydrolase CwlJ-like protein
MRKSMHKSGIIPLLFITIVVSTFTFSLNNNIAVADAAPTVVAPPLISTIPNTELDFEEIKCLALNAYFEAGIEGYAGKLAVSNVVINRVKSSNFPDNICAVVQQGKYHASGMPKRNLCQFSWWCDGKSDKPYEGAVWETSKMIAIDIYSQYLSKTLLDITDGSMYYHADYVTPYWASGMKRVVQIDTHIFYK